jgi:cyclic pyranopterin phosphate synthase
VTDEPRFTHLDDAGAARMVDVSSRDVTVREATATGRVDLHPATVTMIRDQAVVKGDVLAVARIAGIAATKRTPDLVPLCHPIAIHAVAVEVSVDDDGVSLSATVRTADRTGVEMEALTAVAVAGLTVIDMVKSVDPGASIEAVHVEAKSGGRSGEWHRSS